ncbi:hypothetical protein [Dyadobacter sediminis]|uniref:Uncharacterized protein n=1 Tax=Dyadobacter sediminis TaxID=1493691 RepID=A0A5R9KBF7_9BACT|nr:hypothetical protein [Dyadobacter sediminis]TLU92173.1 hypothetical protein FEM55_15640 [Dyadobacter sediminis]
MAISFDFFFIQCQYLQDPAGHHPECRDSVYNSTFDFLRNEIGFPKGLGRSETESGYVVPANNGLSLIEVIDNDSLARLMEKKLTSDSFRLCVVYSDVYGNWERTRPNLCPNVRNDACFIK